MLVIYKKVNFYFLIMTVILVEGPQGYALFKLNNKSLLKASPEEIQASFSSLDSAKKW